MGLSQDMLGHVWQSIYTQIDSAGKQHWYCADADWDVLDGVHIGATYGIRLNRPYVAGWWQSSLMSNYFDHLLLVLLQ